MGLEAGWSASSSAAAAAWPYCCPLHAHTPDLGLLRCGSQGPSLALRLLTASAPAAACCCCLCLCVWCVGVADFTLLAAAWLLLSLPCLLVFCIPWCEVRVRLILLTANQLCFIVFLVLLNLLCINNSREGSTCWVVELRA